ncbi:JAB domain-containing protein [Allopusillimonas ginsengisoli]|uniref:JAB domain-containing protein n=1 Tax=Allopusillimonas ginsengisoli TaxID=453575 RepID=UPI0039C190E2
MTHPRCWAVRLAVRLQGNHPPGLTEPSNNDKVITSKLKTILNVDVRVLDHVVVGQREPYSFAEKGLL